MFERPRHSEDDFDQTPDAQHFNPWRKPRTDRALTAVRSAISSIEAIESRSRARRPLDKAKFEATVTALICDLLYRHAVAAAEKTIIVDRSNRNLEARKTRYQHPHIGGSFRMVQDLLARVGLIHIRLGVRKKDSGVRTTIRAREKLLLMLPDARPDDFCLDDDEEVVVLRAQKERSDRAGKELPYCDTVFTREARTELKAINSFIEAADIGVDTSMPGVLAVVDPAKRRLYRIFADGTFDRGGRFYRGCWIDLDSNVRRAALRINGQRTVTLDFGQMAPRLAYAHIGQSPPAGDLYQIGILGSYQRDGIKKLFNAALYSSKPLRQKPRNTADILPKRPVRRLIGDLKSAHAPIAPLLECGAGLQLQRTESNIVMASLQQLMLLGIVALPIHDALIVAEPNADVTERIMTETFSSMTGADAIVSRE